MDQEIGQSTGKPTIYEDKTIVKTNIINHNDKYKYKNHVGVRGTQLLVHRRSLSSEWQQVGKRIATKWTVEFMESITLALDGVTETNIAGRGEVDPFLSRIRSQIWPWSHLGHVHKNIKQILKIHKHLWRFDNIYGGFLKWGYPKIINFSRVSPNKNHPFLGTPIYGNTVHILAGDSMWGLESKPASFRWRCSPSSGLRVAYTNPLFKDEALGDRRDQH